MFFQVYDNDNHFLQETLLRRKKNIKHTVYHELRGRISMPIFHCVLQEAINDVKMGRTCMLSENKRIGVKKALLLKSATYARI